ncbi:MAG: GTP-binding protein [Actinomycetota bacterium]
MALTPVPVTVFAGPGAEAVAASVVGPNECIVAEEWQGPGSVQIRSDIGHRTPDCPCCAMRLDVIDGLLRTVRRARRPTRVLLVAGPDHDLATIVYTILSDADLARHVRLDAVVVAVDAVAIATRRAADVPLGSRVELDALAIADALVVTRTADVTSEGLANVRTALDAVNAVGAQVILPGENPTTPPAVERLRGTVLGLDAWHGAPAVDPHVTVLTHSSGGAPDTVVLRQAAPLDPAAVDEWLDRLIESHAQRLVRMQGALAIESSPVRVCCHGVRSFAMSHSEADDPVASQRTESLLVMVGYDLDVDALTAEFAATRMR